MRDILLILAKKERKLTVFVFQADIPAGGKGEGGVWRDLEPGGRWQARRGAAGEGGQAQPGPRQHQGLGPGWPGDWEKDYGERELWIMRIMKYLNDESWELWERMMKSANWN